MDIKSLHAAIKELRDERDRITLAIQQIEMIAEAVDREERQDGDSPESAPQVVHSSENAD